MNLVPTYTYRFILKKNGYRGNWSKGCERGGGDKKAGFESARRDERISQFFAHILAYRYKNTLRLGYTRPVVFRGFVIFDLNGQIGFSNMKGLARVSDNGGLFEKFSSK